MTNQDTLPHTQKKKSNFDKTFLGFADLLVLNTEKPVI